MLLASDELENLESLDCDVCIVGAGPAGISLALELGKELKVIILEAGQESVSGPSQQAYSGTATGSIIGNDYLSSSRLRCLGGSSGHWAGWCRPFESYDFEGMPWIEDSKWPISFKDISDFYNRAAEYVEIPKWPATIEKLDFPQPFASSSKFRAESFHISPPTRFGTRYRRELAESLNVKVITGATVVDLPSNESRNKVFGAVFKTLSGNEIRVNAGFVVLACGGIENSRLLMALTELGSDKRASWLGAGFSDHAEYTVGLAVLPKSNVALERATLGNSKFEQTQSLDMYFPTLDVLKENRLSNFALQLTSIPIDRCPAEVVEYANVRAELFKTKMEVVHLRLRPAPRMQKTNRVSLDSERDRFGIPKTKLNWNISDSEIQDLREATRVVGAEFSREHNASIRLLLPEENPFEHAQYASHHIGTTRMGISELDGVVDSNSRLFSCSNIYLSGSSVFRTAGVANPTLTILALSIRLAEHIKETYAGRNL